MAHMLIMFSYSRIEIPKKLHTHSPEMVWLETDSLNQIQNKTDEKPFAKKYKNNNRDSSSKISTLKKLKFESNHFARWRQHHQDNSLGWEQEDVMNTMNKTGLEEYSENFNFFESLSSHINNSTSYPQELWTHKLTGQIVVKAQINHKGELIRIIESSKQHPILSAFVTIQLFEALKQPMPSHLWHNEAKTMNFYLQFDFNVSSVPTVESVHKVSYFKNRFHFKRLAKIPSFLEEQSRLYARYIPPIIPTPAGPVIDFIQAYKMIEAWRHDSPLQAKQNQMLLTKEKYNSLLEKILKEKRSHR